MKHCEKQASRRKFITIGATSAAALIGGKALAQSRGQQIATLTHTSVADMVKDPTLKPGDTINTLGYHHPGDDGNNTYTIINDDSLTEDGGSVINVQNNLKAMAIFPGGIVTVEQFGAIGNGEHDNTTALNNAHKLGQVVYYGAKLYNFSQLNIAGGGIVGQGKTTQLVSNDTSDADIITYQGENGLFKDFALSGQAGKNLGAGIKLATKQSNETAHIQNVHINNLPTALHSQNAQNYRVRDCRFEQFKTAGIYIEAEQSITNSDIGIHNNTLITNHDEATAIDYLGGSINITHNKIIGGMVGVALSANGESANACISGNTIEQQNQNAICTNANAGLVTITQNRLNAIDVKGAAILVDSSTDSDGELSINNNVIRFGGNAESIAAIDLQNATSFMVNNNTINCLKGKGHRGIYIAQSCNSGVLSANHVILPQNGHTLNLSKTTVMV